MNTFWQWNDVTEADQDPDQFTVEYLVTEPREEGAQHWALSPSPATAPGTPMPTPAATLATPPKPVEFATPRTIDSTLDANHDDGLAAKFWKIENLLGEGEPPGPAVHEFEEEVAELHAISMNEPNSFAEAEKKPCWLKAM